MFNIKSRIVEILILVVGTIILLASFTLLYDIPKFIFNALRNILGTIF